MTLDLRRATPTRRTVRRVSVLSTLLLCAASSLAVEPGEPAWVTVWGAPPARPTGPSLRMQTVRQIVRLSLGGQALRLRLSNELGDNPVEITAVHIARPGKTLGSIDPATDRVVTFGGQETLTMQPGAPLLSDPLAFPSQPLEEIVISFLVTRATGPVATHPLAMATAFIADAGAGSVSSATFAKPSLVAARFFVTAVEVQRSDAQTVVAMGDSITDGYASSPDLNHRWPDYLAQRLAAAHRPIAVVNAGISGNRILHDLPEVEYGPSALARLDRDVLSVAGAHTLILLESINDIGMPASSALPEQAVSAAAIVTGMQQIIARAHARGIRVIGGTLTPFADADYPGYYDGAAAAKRQVVNRWIREAHAFDAVVDFDAALRDPNRPERLLPAYDCGDHLHPNDAGYLKMAETIDLQLLESPPRLQPGRQ